MVMQKLFHIALSQVERKMISQYEEFSLRSNAEENALSAENYLKDLFCKIPGCNRHEISVHQLLI